MGTNHIQMAVSDGINEGLAPKEKVIRRAKDIFADKADDWLNAPIPALGGQVPMQLIETEEGAAMVLDELGRIEQGVFI